MTAAPRGDTTPDLRVTGTGFRGRLVRRNDGGDDNGGEGFAALHGVAGWRPRHGGGDRMARASAGNDKRSTNQ
jgi:hypothetical protein